MAIAPKSPQFRQHPVALGGRSLLNAAAYIGLDVVPGTDVFLFGPPPATDVDSNGGMVVREISQATPIQLHSVGADPILATDLVQVVYKAEGGREVVIAEEAALHNPGSAFFLEPDCNFVMSPNDIGVFLRLVQAVAGPSPAFDAVMQSFDVRGLRRIATDISAVEAIVAPGGSAAAADLVYENTSDDTVDVFFTDPALMSYAAIHNYDSVDHTYQLFITDGLQTIEISKSFAPGISVNANRTGLFTLPALQPGWSVRMSLGEDVVDFDPRCIISPFQTNFDVARNDQAGAY